MEQWNCIFIKINLYINIFMRKCGCPQNKGKVDNLSHTPKSRHLRTRERGGAGKKKSANFCDVFCGRYPTIHHNFIVHIRICAVASCANVCFIDVNNFYYCINCQHLIYVYLNIMWSPSVTFILHSFSQLYNFTASQYQF